VQTAHSFLEVTTTQQSTHQAFLQQCFHLSFNQWRCRQPQIFQLPCHQPQFFQLPCLSLQYGLMLNRNFHLLQLPHRLHFGYLREITWFSYMMWRRIVHRKKWMGMIWFLQCLLPKCSVLQVSHSVQWNCYLRYYFQSWKYRKLKENWRIKQWK
jgi:hypothetical protein